MIRRLIGIAALAFSLVANADAATFLRAQQGTYDSDAVAYFNALTGNSCTAPSVAFKQAVSAYIVAEKAAANWGSQDWTYIFATADTCTASINLAQPSLYKITWNGSPTFTVQFGLPGDGATQYGDLNVQQVNLLRMSQNNAHVDVWVHANKTNALGLLAIGTRLRMNTITNKTTVLNSNSSITDTNGGAVTGLNFAWRTDSSNVTTGFNGVVQTSAGAAASAAMGASDVVIGQNNGTFTTAGANILFSSGGQVLGSESTHYTNVRNLLLALGVTGI